MRLRTALTALRLVLGTIFALGSWPTLAEPLQFDITGEVYQSYGATTPVPVGTFTVVTELDSSSSLTLFGPSELPFTMQHFDISSVINIPPGGIPCGPNSSCGSFFDVRTGFPVYSEITFCPGCANEVDFGSSVGFGDAGNAIPVLDSLTLSAGGVAEHVRVPEPETLALLALGLGSTALFGRRSKIETQR